MECIHAHTMAHPQPYHRNGVSPQNANVQWQQQQQQQQQFSDPQSDEQQLRTRPFSLDEALPYTPFTSVFPFDSGKCGSCFLPSSPPAYRHPPLLLPCNYALPSPASLPPSRLAPLHEHTNCFSLISRSLLFYDGPAALVRCKPPTVLTCIPVSRHSQQSHYWRRVHCTIPR